MKVSVIIPLYNGAKLIERTLDSVLAQTYKDYEIILVNDESPDNVGEVVNEYMEKHQETDFVYIEQKNKGLGGARNSGVRQASGEVIAILDQDDIWYSDKLEITIQAFKNHPDIAIISHDLHDHKDGEISGIRKNGPGAKDMHRALLYSGNLLSTPAVTFKKKIMEDVGYFSESKLTYLCEDYDLWLRAAKAGHLFHFIPEILGGYTLHENNFTNSSREEMFQSVINIIDDHYCRLEKRKLSDWFRFRRTKANIYYNWAYYRFCLRKPFLKYLWKSFKADPLFISLYIKVAKITLKTMLGKEKIR
ncbi:MAG: glycosyltransferase [Candidatus Margulisiibacteriota bacterium]|nr:glycosyltransferase [Candidatus Margulisiibacteriota bacterium]